MSVLLDIVLILAVFGAVLDGLRGGLIKGALRLVGVVIGLMLASAGLRVILTYRGDSDPWTIFLTMLFLPGLFAAFAELLYRALFGSADLEPAADDEPGVKFKRVARDLFLLEPNRSLAGRIAGAVFAGLATGIGNGVFVLVLQIAPLEWVNAVAAGASTADRFIPLARAVSFALPPELRVW